MDVSLTPLTQRARNALTFIADMHAVSAIHLAQFLAPNFEPATNTGHGSADQSDQEKKPPASRRGGNRRHAPWPRDYHQRLKAVSRLLTLWKQAGWITVTRPWSGEPSWISVTQSAIDRLGLPYTSTAFPSGEDELEHLFQITRVRLFLGYQATQPENTAAFAHTWISERAIVSTFPRREEGMTLPHLPDGLVELDADAAVRMADATYIDLQRGDRIAVEVERSRKSFVRLHTILPSLLREYAGVWYFASPKAADALLKAKEDLVEQGTLTPGQAILIRVIGLDQF